VQCLNYQGRDKIGSPEVALNCARAAGIDWETSGSGQCAGLDGSGKGLEGVQLLRESIMMSRQLGIEQVTTDVNRAIIADVFVGRAARF